jgi:flagellar biosynthesis protein FliR
MFGLPDQIQHWLPFTMLVFVRLSAMMTTMPILGFSTVAGRIRIAMALILTLIIAPSVGENFTTEYSSLAVLVVDIMRELMIGLFVGFGARLVFEAFTLAGGFVSFQMGLSMINIVDPNSGSNAPVIGNFWLLVLIMFFLVTNSHHFLMEVLFFNFKAIPLTEAKFDPVAGQTLINAGSLIYELAVRFAAPMMVLMLINDVAIAFAARVMPQLNIFFISLPMKLGVGIFMILISLKIFQTMFGFIYNNFESLTLDIIAGIKGA